jgi:hypothetical protein
MADDFETYFTAYARAFDDFDADAITSYFCCPCTMVSANFVASLDSPSAIQRNVDGILGHHRAEGYHCARVSDFQTARQAENLAIVSVRWRVYKSDESLLWEWDNSYNLVDYGLGSKILVSTVHESI